MFDSETRVLLPLVSLLIFGLGLVGCDQATVPGEKNQVKTATSVEGQLESHVEAPGIEGLEAVRNTTEEYKDLAAAKADGYMLFSPFVPGMGFHYLHESAVNEDGTSSLDRRLNRTDPEILVYSDTEENSGQFAPHDEDFAAVEYAIPKREGEEHPPEHAVALFNNADAHDWHIHPSVHELPLENDWTVHGECHYEGGIGVFLVEDPNGDYKLFTPPTGAFGSWSGTIEPDQCPSSLGGNPLPPLHIVHGKWWTLHAWVWLENPAGVFHPTNPNVVQ